MATSQPIIRAGMTEAFEQLMRAHDEEVARLREQFGDPQVALFAFTRDRLDRESLIAGAPQNGDRRASDEDDDADLDAW